MQRCNSDSAKTISVQEWNEIAKAISQSQILFHLLGKKKLKKPTRKLASQFDIFKINFNQKMVNPEQYKTKAKKNWLKRE